MATNIQIPTTINNFLILKTIQKSNKFTITMDDNTILTTHNKISQFKKLLTYPKNATTYTTYKQTLTNKLIQPNKSTIDTTIQNPQTLKKPIKNQPSSLIII